MTHPTTPRPAGRPARPASWGVIVIIVIAITILGGTAWLATRAVAKKAETEKKETADKKATSAPATPPEYPRSGSGHLTKDVGIKAFIDPAWTYTRPTGRVRFVFVKDPEIVFDDLAGVEVERDPKRDRAWRRMPAGEYIVYSLENRKIWFKWWM